MSIISFTLLIITFLIASLALIWSTSAIKSIMLGAPIISSRPSDVIKALEMASVAPKQKIIDLGCGDGKTLVLVCQKFDLIGVGYEATLWGYLLGQINIRRYQLSKRVKIFHQNFYLADLKDADIIYLYLLPKVLSRLEPKLKKELNTGAKIISYAFPLPNWPPSQIIDSPANPKIKIYFYSIIK